MARKSKGPRLYTRSQGGALRYYAYLRSAGGGREAMIPPGETQGTTDPVIAQKLLSGRLEQLQETRRDQALLGVRRRVGLQDFAAEHLVKKKRTGKVTDAWLLALENELRVAVEFFGADRSVASIGVEHVGRYVQHLAERPNGRGGTLSVGAQRHYLNALGNLFRRALSEGVTRGANPVHALMDKPSAARAEAHWLEVWEGALLLEAARTYPYDLPDDSSAAARLQGALRTTTGTSDDALIVFAERMRQAGALAPLESIRAYLGGSRIPTKAFLLTAAHVLELPSERLWRPRGAVSTRRPDRALYPLLATFLLTGGRESEICGLELGDVSLRRKTITFRPTERRRLKTATSHRTIPYWTQLQEILEPHMEDRRRDGATDRDLVFRSGRTGGMLQDIRRGLDAIAKTVGWEPGTIRTKAFRHTYCAARLQTLDRGAAVSEYTVGKEMGHGGYTLVRRVYGHLGEIPHRSEAVEYRIEQQREAIPPERLRLLLRIA